MKIAVIQISEAGKDIAFLLQRELGAKIISRQYVGKQWKDFDAFVFIGAMGICVRTIAPYIQDKHEDPAVVCVDSMGLNVISVLSGHVGGANLLTQDVAALLGAREVITTQSDLLGLWALDTFDQTYGWDVSLSEGHGTMNDVIATFVRKEPTALLLDIRDEGTDFLETHLPSHVTLVSNASDVRPERFRLLMVVSPFSHSAVEGVQFIQYIPRVLQFGIGLAHQAPLQEVLEGLDALYYEHGINWEAGNICTIDIKADEPVIQYLKSEGYTVRFFTAEELSKVAVPTPSETVEKHVGTPSVCEAAALLASNHGKLLLPKVKGKNFTLAVAIDRKYLREGHIEIVVTECHKPGAVVRSSADMALEEQCLLMKQFYDQGKFIVRLHTGDPCIFGAIQEQMAFFDQNHMDYHITPGISSFLAAAAELQSQFTIPERCQTIILTRGEGRTPMPEKEQLHLLAKSQSTMCIFLSAAIVDDVQRELLQEYPEDTPVAACYHLTWPDQKIYRGQLKDLAKIVHDNHLTLTTMLVVGEAIDNRQGLSELYSKHFTHLFRRGDDDTAS